MPEYEVEQKYNSMKSRFKLKISEELAESICRMYLTHPGVDVAGIIQRIS
ncbi:hypothetical protein [Butyrivibrio sp. JL13D10]